MARESELWEDYLKRSFCNPCNQNVLQVTKVLHSRHACMQENGGSYASKKGETIMPRNQFQRMVFAFITVLITVHSYIFYSLYVVNGSTLMQITGESSVLGAINKQGGVYMFGSFLPIWSVVLVEFCFAFGLECIMGSPCSFKLAARVFDPRKNHPMMLETAIICATVGLMCPAMSLSHHFYIIHITLDLTFSHCLLIG